MNDLPPESQPGPPPEADPAATQALPAERAVSHPSEPQTPASAPLGDAPPQERVRDRLWSLRAVIAVALASVIVGGLGGATLANVSGHGDDARFGPGRFGRGGPGGPPGMMNPGGGGPGGMSQWQDRRGMGQRQWTQEGPGRSVTPLPAPSPSPTR